MSRAARRFLMDRGRLRMENKQQVLRDEDVDIRCFNNHKLTYMPRFTRPFTGWGCDMGIFDGGPEIADRTNGLKERYGLKSDEEWNCERGFEYPNWWYPEDDIPLYMCEVCEFCLCEKCYERAYYYRWYAKVLEDALRVTDSVEWMQSKLMVVGEGGAGKTSTVRTLLGLKFNAKWESTVGASLTHAKVTGEKTWTKKEKDESNNLLLAAAEIVELPTKEFLHEGVIVVTKDDEEGAKAALGGKRSGEELSYVGVDDANAEEEEEEKEEVDEDEEGASGMKEGEGETEEIARRMDVSMVNEANKTKGGIKFTIWDYGGQSVFYSLHHLFLSKYGVYLVVFNLASFFKNEDASREFLTFWLNSINLHAPEAPLLLIGTYLDKLDKRGVALKKIELRVSTYVRPYPSAVRNDKRGLSFFPLSNKSGVGMALIRRTIEETSREQDFLYTKVPVRWLRCLDKLTSDDQKSWVPLSKAKEMAKKCDINAASEVEAMLHYFNQVGVVLHFTSTVALEQKVIVNPQWLIDQVGKVIRDLTIHQYSKREFVAVGLKEDLESLCTQAVASHDILLYLWSHQTIEFLIDLMRRVMLLSDWKFGSSDDSLYLIPSLLKGSRTIQVDGPLSVKYDFRTSFLPEGVIQRLVCLCVEYAIRQGSTKAPVVSHDSAEVYLPGDVSIQLYQEDNAIYVSFSPEELEAPSKYLTVINSMFRKLNTDAMSGGLEWTLLFKDTDGELKRRPDVSSSSPWFESDKKKAQRPQETGHGKLDLEAFMDAL